MAFGQPSGPPASAKQIQRLLELLAAAGHQDFRDARGPMGFTQRQANGKFTRDEADTFIERLESEAEDAARSADGAVAETTTPASDRTRPVPERPRRASTAEQAVRKMPSDLLAAELQRRGWVVMEP
jgi:hypothetical protein